MTDDATSGPTDLLAAERRLQQAQRDGDVDTLDALLLDGLLAVGTDGDLATKAEDLTAHRSGALRISEVVEEDLRWSVHEGTAVTFLLARVAGTAGGQPFAARVRYTRTWVRTDTGWRVLAAHIGLLPGG